MQSSVSTALHLEGSSGGVGAGSKEGRDWYCIATGPSLTREDAQKARQAAKDQDGRVIVVNDNYRHPDLTDADYLYACDEKWWKHHLPKVKEVFTGELWTQYHNDSAKKFAEKSGINVVQGKGGQGLGEEFVYHASNSGHQAINLAYVLSKRMGETPTRIILLGYDMGATGRTHWFGQHPAGWTTGNYSGFAHQFDGIARDLKKLGVDCVNCTPTTNLKQFRMASLDATLSSG